MNVTPSVASRPYCKFDDEFDCELVNMNEDAASTSATELPEKTEEVALDVLSTPSEISAPTKIRTYRDSTIILTIGDQKIKTSLKRFPIGKWTLPPDLKQPIRQTWANDAARPAKIWINKALTQTPVRIALTSASLVFILLTIRTISHCLQEEEIDSTLLGLEISKGSVEIIFCLLCFLSQHITHDQLTNFLFDHPIRAGATFGLLPLTLILLPYLFPEEPVLTNTIQFGIIGTKLSGLIYAVRALQKTPENNRTLEEYFVPDELEALFHHISVEKIPLLLQEISEKENQTFEIQDAEAVERRNEIIKNLSEQHLAASEDLFLVVKARLAKKNLEKDLPEIRNQTLVELICTLEELVLNPNPKVSMSSGDLIQLLGFVTQAQTLQTDYGLEETALHRLRATL